MLLHSRKNIFLLAIVFIVGLMPNKLNYYACYRDHQPFYCQR